MMMHFHTHLWPLQYIHNVIIVPDGNNLTTLRNKLSGYAFLVYESVSTVTTKKKNQ